MKILGEAGKQEFYNKCSENSTDLESSSEQIFSENWCWVPLAYEKFPLKNASKFA